jgi:hypothetical protein
MSQPIKRLSAASRTRVSMRARAPSKTMVSWGSHSSAAPSSTVSSRRCDASGPPLRYHLPAPGVVSWAWAPAPTVAEISRWSPPAMPDGGCSTMAWQTPSPSG